VFIGPAIAASHSGVSSILAWVILAVIAIYVSACFGELVSMFPNAGGVYEYAKRAYGHFPSFMIGWMTWLVANITACLMVIAAMGYLVPLLNKLIVFALAEPLKTQALQLIASKSFDLVFSAIIILIFNYIAFKGIDASATLLVFFAVVTIGVILAVILPGAADVQMENFDLLFAASPLMIAVSLFFIMETFFGWESVTFLAEETKDAEKVIPISLVVTTTIVTLLGLVVAFVMLGIFPVDQLSGMATPFENIASRFYSSAITDIILAGVVISLFGSAAGGVISSPRLILALARDKLFINRLSDIHPVYQTPHKAILFQTIVTIIVIIIGFGAYKIILQLLVPMALIMYISVLLTVPILRWKHPDMKRPFRVPFGKIGPILIAIVYGLTIYSWLIDAPGNLQIFRLIISFIGFGIPIYLLLLFHYDPDVVVRLNDVFAYMSLFFERLLVPARVMREIFGHLGSLKGKSVLEFGCGVGTITTELVKRVGPEGMVYATDLSAKSVKIAERRTNRIGLNNVKFIHDIHQVNRVHHEIPQVDYIVSVGMLGYIQDINKVLWEMHRILPEGGRIFFVDYIDLFKIIPNVSWLSHHDHLKALFRAAGYSVKVEKVKGFMWNYLFVYGIKTSEKVPFV